MSLQSPRRHLRSGHPPRVCRTGTPPARYDTTTLSQPTKSTSVSLRTRACPYRSARKHQGETWPAGRGGFGSCPGPRDGPHRNRAEVRAPLNDWLGPPGRGSDSAKVERSRSAQTRAVPVRTAHVGPMLPLPTHRSQTGRPMRRRGHAAARATAGRRYLRRTQRPVRRRPATRRRSGTTAAPEPSDSLPRTACTRTPNCLGARRSGRSRPHGVAQTGSRRRAPV